MNLCLNAALFNIFEDISSKLAAANIPNLIAGGCVRDSLLRKPGRDIDVFLHCESQEELQVQFQAVSKALGRSFDMEDFSETDYDEDAVIATCTQTDSYRLGSPTSMWQYHREVERRTKLSEKFPEITFRPIPPVHQAPVAIDIADEEIPF